MALRGRFLVGSQAAARRPGAPLHPLRRRERDRDLPAAGPTERRREPGLGKQRRARGRWPLLRRPGVLRLHAQPPAGGREGPPAGGAGRRPHPPPRPRRGARPGHLRPRPQRATGGLRRAGRPLLPGHRRKRAGDGDRSRPPGRRADRRRRAAGRLHAAPGRGRGAVRRADRARARARRRRRAGLGGVAVHRRPRHLTDARPADSAADHAAHRLQPAPGRAGRRPRRPAADAGRPRSAGRGAGGVQAGADRLRHAAAGPAGGRHPGRPGGAPRALRAALGRGVGRHGRVPLRRLRQPAPGDRAGGGGARRRAARSSSRPSTTWRWREPRASPPARRTCFWSRCSGRTHTACCSPSATAASATTSSATASSAPSPNASAS